MNKTTKPTPRPQQGLGALVILKPGTSRSMVERRLKLALGKDAASIVIKEYDLKYGNPVWYIP